MRAFVSLRPSNDSDRQGSIPKINRLNDNTAMDANYTIDVQPSLNLVKIKMGGFYNEPDIHAFRFTLTEKMRSLRCGANQHLTLCNVVDMKIQLQAIVDAFSKVVGDPRFRSKRLAFVTGSTLARMQTQRLTTREGVAFFTDEAEARAWLLG